MDVSDGFEPITPGTWRRAVEIDGDRCRSTTPCCVRPIAVTLAHLSELGVVSVRCPACEKPWDLHYDPWTPVHEALWIE